MAIKRGQLILIEGLDRTGKSTQGAVLNQRIPNSKLIKFPDRSTNIGKIINNYLVDETFTLSDQSAHLLFLANRWELANSIIEDLQRGIFIILDRYVYSGLAYSLAKLRMSKEASNEMSDKNWLFSPDKGLPKPDLTLFLTIDLEELGNRKGWGEERYEKQEFQKEVKSCFLEVLDQNDPSVCIVDVNNQDIPQVSETIWNIVERANANKLIDSSIKTL